MSIASRFPLSSQGGVFGIPFSYYDVVHPNFHFTGIRCWGSG